MAWLEPHPTSGHFNICFRWEGRKLRRTLKTASQKDATAILHRFEENMVLLERGRLEMPDGADVATFLLSDGKLDGIPKAEGPELEPPRTLREIVDGYLATLGNGTIEANSLATVRMHLQHVIRKFGNEYHVADLNATLLQEYVNTRKRRKGKKKIP